jgi:hypothetical protein
MSDWTSARTRTAGGREHVITMSDAPALLRCRSRSRIARLPSRTDAAVALPVTAGGASAEFGEPPPPGFTVVPHRAAGHERRDMAAPGAVPVPVESDVIP